MMLFATMLLLLHLGVNGQDIIVTIEVDPDREFYTVGETLTLMCVLDPVPSDVNVSYFWECSGCFADGVTMPTISRVLNDTDGDSMINCSVIINDNVIMSNMTFDLQVIQVVDRDAPDIVIAYPGQDVELLCPVSTNAEVVGWVINDTLFEEPTKYPSGYSLNGNNLIVENIMINDFRNNTEFKCMMLLQGNFSDEIVLYVADTSREIPNLVIAHPGEDFELMCAITSSKHQIVSWIINGMGPYEVSALLSGTLAGYSSNENNLIVQNLMMNDVRNGSSYSCVINLTIAILRQSNLTLLHVDDDTSLTDATTPVSELYPFGFSEDDSILGRQIDYISPRIILSESFYFYGQAIRNLFVGDNGIISLNEPFNDYIPFGLPVRGKSFIAPYWADFDLTAAGNVFYRQTRNPVLLARATNEIQAVFPMSQNVFVINLFIVTWDAVGYYSNGTDKVNTLQCVLATTLTESFVMFRYPDGEIQWTTGDDSNGIDGLGGIEALAGINGHDGVNFTSIPGSLSRGILNITHTSNIGISGVWMFKVGEGKPFLNVFLQPNIPFANQRQDIMCSISVLDADSDKVELGWFNEEDIITDDNRVTIFEPSIDLTINSSNFTPTVITTIIQFDPLLKIDEGNYSCYYSVVNGTEISTSIQLVVATYDVTVIALNPEEIGQLLIIDCSSTSDIPSTENQIVGDPLILRCNLNTSISFDSINFTWSSNNVTLRNVTYSNQFIRLQDHYVIPQLNTSDHGQEYKCDAMINAIPPVAERGVIVLDLTVPDFMVTVSSSNLQEIMVGDSQDIRCTVEVDFDGVELNSVKFNWLGPVGTPITYDSRVTVSPINSSDDTFVSILQFSYLMEKDDGIYTCCVMILSTNWSKSIELGKLNVPTPNVTIIASHDDIIVGQPLSLECIITTVRGINSQVNIRWSKGSNKEELKRESVTANVTMFSSVMYRDCLSIPQITTDDDNETYKCEVIINTSSPVTASDNYTVHVVVPNISIAIGPNGLTHGAMVGNNQIIHCTIRTVNGVRLNAIRVNWTGPGGASINNNSRTIISLPIFNSSSNSTNNFSTFLEFKYLMQRDEGRYMCNVSILQANASITIEVGALIVPSPTVSVAILTNQTAGEPLTLYCNVTTVKGIESTVNITWLIDGSELEIQDINVFSTSDNMQLYMTAYTIDHLSGNDHKRVYQCRVLIYSDMLVMASNNLTLNVTGIEFGDSTSDGSTSFWIIVGICAGVILLIATTLLCLLLLKKRRSKDKILRMRTADVHLHPLSNPTYDLTLKNIAVVSKPISAEEWKKELAGYLIDYNSLDIKDAIASGKFGIVYKAFYTSKEDTIIEVAVKTVKYFSSQTAESFVKECNIANKFDHPNVLSLIGVCIIPEEDVPLMVMPYMHHGDIKSFVKSKRENNIKVEKYPSGLSEEILTKMCYDIARGMDYLAIKHFVHRDLAARNCMLDQNMTTKVADFGLSRDVYVTEYYTTSHSTPLPVKWLAPEALFDRYFNEKTDVWAFGVTCWEVFSLGLQPYPLIGPSEIGDYIKSGKILDKPQLSSDEMYEIMKTCWKFKADERPNFSDLVKVIDHLKSTPQMTQSKKFIKKESAAYLPVYS